MLIESIRKRHVRGRHTHGHTGTRVGILLLEDFKSHECGLLFYFLVGWLVVFSHSKHVEICISRSKRGDWEDKHGSWEQVFDRTSKQVEGSPSQSISCTDWVVIRRTKTFSC